jgi:hypothetical protein
VRWKALQTTANKLKKAERITCRFIQLSAFHTKFCLLTRSIKIFLIQQNGQEDPLTFFIFATHKKETLWNSNGESGTGLLTGIWDIYFSQ